MKPIRIIALNLLLMVALLLPSSPAWADGIIIPEPPICVPGPCPRPIPMAQLAIKYHRVQVTIEDQVATTHVDQVFRNDNDWQIEGTYIFPIPTGASISQFTMWMEGEAIEGKILTKEEARRTYEDIVRNLQDPALLEYLDRGAVQASIFPIPPGGERRIELEYREVLTADQGLIQYRYPLNTEKFSTLPLEEVVVTVLVDSAIPIRAVYSPSHEVSIDRPGEYGFVAGYEAYQVIPDKDFDLFYSISEAEFGLNLISYRDPLGEEKDGFFLLIAAPSVKIDPEQAIVKDVILVLDQSGSMQGEKFQQAQQALHYVLDHLNPEDRFNIIAFSTGLTSYANTLRPAAEAPQAKRWVDSLSASGSTDINRALLEAISIVGRQRPTMLIFLTDGLPTEGITDTQVILANIAKNAPKNVRLFAFGVGYDVDTFLLDTLTQENHGRTTYVTPDQAIDEVVSGFYTKINDPVLTDIELDFGEIIVYDLYPKPLPDLFAGMQLIAVGRYKDSGNETVRLAGDVNGKPFSFEYPQQRFRSMGGPDFLPRLWATRKIGALLNQIRLQGAEKELIDQIVQLSIRYGIITPYTSFLVTEPAVLGAAAQDAIASEAYENYLASPQAVVGEAAVERAAESAKIMGADLPSSPAANMADLVRIAGANTFRLLDGKWIDTRFDPDHMQTQKVPFLSQDYFELASASADIATAFALGERVIVLLGENAYEVVGTDAEGDEITIPPPSAEDTPQGPAEEANEPGQDHPSKPKGVWPLCSSVFIGLGMLFVPRFFRARRS